MTSHLRRTLFTTFFLMTTLAGAEEFNADDYYGSEDDYSCCEDVPPNFNNPNKLSLAPEYYRVSRTRSGGTKQSGNAGGIRLSYDYIKRYTLYFGGQAFYGTGTLNGHTGSGDKIRSRLTDAQIEGSLGYTFQMKCFPYPSITPYVGCGYFQETNKFSHPSPLTLKYTTKFGYVAFGFLSQIYVNRCFSAGLNARFRWPWEPKCKVSNDPEFDNLSQRVGDCIQYRIELPLTHTNIQLMGLCSTFEIGLVPFYEMREYGARENYPFDFLKTRFNLYGVNLQLSLRF